jgi:hypothetical protein
VNSPGVAARSAVVRSIFSRIARLSRPCFMQNTAESTFRRNYLSRRGVCLTQNAHRTPIPGVDPMKAGTVSLRHYLVSRESIGAGNTATVVNVRTGDFKADAA